jgi:ubiquinone/menaquinone biosynthesis C-methylase UbiE
MNEYIQTNRAHWDDAVPHHVGSEFYDVASFKAGRNTLLPVELTEIGDVAGKTMLHLQCHFGMDTLSWARLGAKVTGIDFSAPAIEQARALATELGIEARFIESNVYELPDRLDERFDIVFASYGVVPWLPDFAAWAKVAAHFVRPGGFVYLLDGHPLMSVFDFDQPVPAFKASYFDRTPQSSEGEGTYATDRKLEHNATFEFQHTVGDIVTAFADAGLRVEYVHEFPFAAWAALKSMTKGDDGYYRFPPGVPEVPLMMSLKATKPD